VSQLPDKCPNYLISVPNYLISAPITWQVSQLSDKCPIHLNSVPIIWIVSQLSDKCPNHLISVPITWLVSQLFDKCPNYLIGIPTTYLYVFIYYFNIDSIINLMFSRLDWLWACQFMSIQLLTLSLTSISSSFEIIGAGDILLNTTVQMCSQEILGGFELPSFRLAGEFWFNCSRWIHLQYRKVKEMWNS